MPDVDLDLTDDLLDLDAHRAARREARGRTPRLRIGGNVYDLPVEFPLDVLAPLLDVNLDLGLIAKVLLDAMDGDDPEGQREAIGLVLDLLITNPTLPTEAIEAAQNIARNLLGDDAYAALIDSRPSREDLSALVRGLIRLYGVSLGESSPSTDSSSSGGETSNETSSSTTESTPETSGEAPETPA